MSARELERSDIINAALEAGFMIHTGYGQNAGQLMPVSDETTLTHFANLIRDLLELTQ